MKEIGAVTIGKLIEAHYEKDEQKFKSYADFIADAYKERGEERAERIIRSRIDGSYKNKPKVIIPEQEIEKMNKGNKNKWWLNGGCDSGRTIRLLCEVYENKIAELQHKVDTLQGFLDHDIEYDMYKTIQGLRNENAELNDEVKELKLLVSSLVYEINQIWDINEMNDDLRMCAEKIDREVQLSKMAEDNRMVISALGFAIVPPKPKLDVKEI